MSHTWSSMSGTHVALQVNVNQWKLDPLSGVTWSARVRVQLTPPTTKSKNDDRDEHTQTTAGMRTRLWQLCTTECPIEWRHQGSAVRVTEKWHDIVTQREDDEGRDVYELEVDVQASFDAHLDLGAFPFELYRIALRAKLPSSWTLDALSWAWAPHVDVHTHGWLYSSWVVDAGSKEVSVTMRRSARTVFLKHGATLLALQLLCLPVFLMGVDALEPRFGMLSGLIMTTVLESRQYHRFGDTFTWIHKFVTCVVVWMAGVMMWSGLVSSWSNRHPDSWASDAFDEPEAGDTWAGWIAVAVLLGMYLVWGMTSWRYVRRCRIDT